MLNAVRRHASSWMIRVIFGAIITTFIFFFGYSTLRKAGRGGDGEAVATVNGIPIPAAEFELAYNNTLERFRQSFKDKEIPDFVRDIAKNNALQQMVGRELMLSEANKLGVVLTDQEVADVIRQAVGAQSGSEFDPIFYRHQYLPYFKNRFGLDYEEFVREDLKAEAIADMFATVDSRPLFDKGEMGSGREINWTFEVVAIDLKALLDFKLIKTEGEAEGIAKGLISLPYPKWKGHLNKFKLKAERIGPISVSGREKLMGGGGSLTDFEKIFSLTQTHSVLDTPVKAGAKIYVIRLVEKKEVRSDAAPEGGQPPFFNAWMEKLRASAKVVSFIEEK